jgi:hypothetical protein
VNVHQTQNQENTKTQPLCSLQPKQQEKKNPKIKPNQTKNQGGGGDEMGKGGAGCGLSPTVLVGAGFWVVPLSRSHLSLSAKPSEEMK